MENPKAKLRGQADKLWYEKYLKDRCEVCGEGGILQAHHFYYRSSFSILRYSEENHITLCRKCHFVLHHQDPKKVEEKIIEKRGGAWYHKIKKKAKEKPKPGYLTMDYYRQVLEKLKK